MLYTVIAAQATSTLAWRFCKREGIERRIHNLQRHVGLDRRVIVVAGIFLELGHSLGQIITQCRSQEVVGLEDAPI